MSKEVGQRDSDKNPLLHPNVQAMIPWLIIFLLGIIGYFWQSSQASLSERLIGYDQQLASIAETGLANRGDIVALRTKQDAGRGEWELREARVLSAVEKNTLAIDRLASLVTQTNNRITILEQAVKHNTLRLDKIEK